MGLVRTSSSAGRVGSCSGGEEGEGTPGLRALCPWPSPGPGTGNNMDGLRERQKEAPSPACVGPWSRAFAGWGCRSRVEMGVWQMWTESRPPVADGRVKRTCACCGVGVPAARGGAGERGSSASRAEVGTHHRSSEGTDWLSGGISVPHSRHEARP